MQTIYRCQKCGQEYTSKEQAEKHDCTGKYRVKRCSLWISDEVVFSTKTSTRFSKRHPKPDETIYASMKDSELGPYHRYEVETTDLSEENEKYLHKELLEIAIDDREMCIEPLRKALKKLEQED